ncbi:uncharacterized protein LOC129739999 [Uranotaenia lowii]|uniref:uncharacterized protein LOC129739999 n=1 Tax=Uranotaenia lowii TaxID=190385 RepID=UPI00247A21BE|nr:uncharacterized protein LOC129739999 [Uranotaenia lowii]XP_055587554.1 uncharacterized protein LOC129739999 [Uranotaenia lowii]
MGDDSLLIERATDLIKCCKLPRLTRSVDEAPLTPATFQEFLACLNATLPKIFDLITQHGNRLLGYDPYNQDNLDFRLQLVLIVTEQLHDPQGPVLDFQTEHLVFRAQISRIYSEGLLENIVLGEGADQLQKHLWQHYQKVLPGKEWMFHLGDLLSFIRICELLFSGLLPNVPELTQSIASLMLSIGISLVEYHDPEYELFGLRLFNVLLNKEHRKLMMDSNIHQVVFQNAFRLNAKSKKEQFLRNLWQCHYQYLELTEAHSKDFSKWSKLDDVIETLLDGLAFEQNLEQSSVLLLYLLKLLTIDLPNHTIDDLDDIQALDNKCHLYEPVLEDLRKLCALEFRNRRFYRWQKRLLSMLPFELEKATSGISREHGRYMHGVNLLFVLVVFAIEPEAIDSTLEAKTALVNFLITFKQHMRDQYGRIQAIRGKCDFLHSLKASVSCDKSISVFGRSVVERYFKDCPEMLTLFGPDGEESYQEDRIFYECLKELQRNN